MTSCSVTFDYDHLHAELLGLNEQATFPHPRSTRVDNATRSVRQPSQSNNTNATVVLDYLPATVPDSVLIDNTDAAPDSHNRVSRAAGDDLKNMSDADLPSDTQPISQSYVDEVARRSRSELESYRHDGESNVHHAAATETQMTVNEGDDGHLDILSSFNQPAVDDYANPAGVRHAEEEETQPITFSPTQTQHVHLTQYPDSQRFKTPATNGKKRDYRGNTIESPALPRNPLARGQQPTPGKLLGLSQVFEATQAGSSPFVKGYTSELRSDRPSPLVDLHARPTTAPSSSPLRPLSGFKTQPTQLVQPKSRYIPVHQSQAARVTISSERDPTNRDESQLSTTDEFTNEPETVQRQRRAKEIEERARGQLRTASSPLPAARSLSRSSPLTPAINTSGAEADKVSIPSSPPALAFDHVNKDVPTNDEDTESYLPQLRQSEGPENESSRQRPRKARHSSLPLQETQVPMTTKRSTRSEMFAFDDVNNQPARNALSISTTDETVMEPPSSTHVRVMNSQPSQTHRSKTKLQTIAQTDQLERIPASPEAAAFLDLKNSQNIRNPSQTSVHAESDTFVRNGHDSVIAETSSNLPAQKISSDDFLASKGEGAEGTKSDTFVTAPSNTLSTRSTRPVELDDSSQQISVTPPGLKRKRLMDIVSQPSSYKKDSDLSDFNPADILALSQDLEHAKTYAGYQDSQSPVRPKRRRPNANSTIPALVPNDQVVAEAVRALVQHERIAGATTEADSQESRGTPGRQVQTTLQAVDVDAETIEHEVKTPTRRARDFSAWDLGDSPVQTRVPFSEKAQTQPPRKLAGRSKIGQPVKGPRNRVDKVSSDGTPPRTAPVQRTSESPDPLSHEFIEGRATSPVPQTNVIVAPEMVFACYFGKTRTYHPARCLGPSAQDSSRFTVQWPGYAPDEVDRFGVSALDLRIGDMVKVDAEGYAKVPYVVRGFPKTKTQSCSESFVTDVHGNETVILAAKQRKSLPHDLATAGDMEVAIASIYLDNNMWGKVKDRLYRPPQSTQAHDVTDVSTPDIRPSTPSTPGSRIRRFHATYEPAKAPHEESTAGMFSNMVFALSIEDQKRKELIADLVRRNGGIMVESSFAELFDTDFALHPQFAKCGFTALLADKHSRKEKYMQALALGLPCISGKWVERCIKLNHICDWRDHLLAAGESAALDGVVRSRVMPAIDAEKTTVTEILAARHNFFNDDPVVLVTGRGKVESKRMTYLFFVQAMGGRIVQKVPDLTAAAAAVHEVSIDSPCWLFVDDKDIQDAQSVLANISNNAMKAKKGKNRKSTSTAQAAASMSSTCRVAGNELIVQSLILGRIFNEEEWL